MPTPPALAAPFPAPTASTPALIEAATADVDTPLAAVDLAAFDANADDLVRRAAGRPIRVATKSLRCRPLLRRVLMRPGFRGALAYTLAEALWLAQGDGPADVVVGYPTAERRALAQLAGDEQAATRITLMVDDPAQLDLVDAVVPPGHRPTVRVCLDLDASLRLLGGKLTLGARRSPLHRPADVVALARAVERRPGFRLVGVMAYEAQVAGVGDRPGGRPLRGLAVRGMQAASMAQVARRRAATVTALASVAPLELVNGGGTGSLERTARDPSVTEVTAGSGLLAPALFDHYRLFRPRPAGLFALSVVRRPDSATATLAGGGWIASGPPGPDRLPVPVHPPGLRLTGTEGAGEVQTPVRGPGVGALRVGDRVWFRHAKAGELCEHVSELHLVADDGSREAAPTYRGEGRAFL